MSKGFCVLAQNNSTTDYVKQAYALALSISKHNKFSNVTLLTNDNVPDLYKHAFDQILPIQWYDDDLNENWKIKNRWKIYHHSPYKETIVLDSDMICCSNIDHVWDRLNNFDLYYTSNVLTYRNEKIHSDYYRKTFTANKLPNLYSAFHYFKKKDYCKQFYMLQQQVVQNYRQFYNKFTPKKMQDWCSIDVSASITAKILGIEDEITDGVCNFIHMKPKLQNFENSPPSWTDILHSDIDNNGNLLVGNFKQVGFFHYVEDNFLSDSLIERLAL